MAMASRTGPARAVAARHEEDLCVEGFHHPHVIFAAHVSGKVHVVFEPEAAHGIAAHGFLVGAAAYHDGVNLGILLDQPPDGFKEILVPAMGLHARHDSHDEGAGRDPEPLPAVRHLPGRVEPAPCRWRLGMTVARSAG